MTPAKQNLVLTGFMATGKSTVGRLVAQRLGWEFVDTDAVIEERHGPIPDIFAEQGEDAFRDLERQVAAELARRSHLVISTGGRMLLDPVNAEALSSTGTVVCLTATAEEILARVTEQQARDGVERPMLGDDPAGRIGVLMAERADGYGRYRQLSTSGRPPEDVVDELLDLVGQENT